MYRYREVIHIKIQIFYERWNEVTFEDKLNNWREPTKSLSVWYLSTNELSLGDRLETLADIHHYFPDVRFCTFCSIALMKTQFNFQIEQLELYNVNSEVCSHAANRFKHLRSICLVGFHFAMPPRAGDYAQPERLVEKIVDMLEPFVERSAELEECRVSFESYTRHSAEQVLLKHPKVRQWSSRIRIRVGGTHVQSNLFQFLD